MTTTYALLLERCGLNLREAADFHRVRPDTVRSWSSGRNPASAGAIAELRDLYARIERAAGGGMAQIQNLGRQHRLPDMIELGLAADDAEAQSLGWPCVGAHAAVLGLVAVRVTVPVRIVPRGTTTATAAAADAHGA